MNTNFTPLNRINVPYGEGALETIFASIERIDPTLQHCTVILVRLDPKKEKYPSLDQIPGPDCELRGDIEMPVPPDRPLTQEEIHALPGIIKVFDAKNAQDVGTFLYSLHHAIHRAANYYTFGVLIQFNPPARHTEAGTPLLAPRAFSRAPITPSTCLLAASGNRIALYSADDASRYLHSCARFLRSDRIAGWTGVHPERLLPYLLMPRWTLDVLMSYDPKVIESDDDVAHMMKQIHGAAGFGLNEYPRCHVNEHVYQTLRSAIFDSYLEWISKEEDHRTFFGAPMPHRFMRSRTFMINRYPRLRDWMMHARIGTNTPNRPTWPTFESMQDVISTEIPTQDALASFGEEPLDEAAAMEQLLSSYEAEEPSTTLYAPNWLSIIAGSAYMHLRRVYIEHRRAPHLSQEEGERAIASLLCDFNIHGLLMFMLAEIADTETQLIVDLHRQNSHGFTADSENS